MTHLVFAEEWEVEEDLDGLGVGGEDDELGDAPVEGLGDCKPGSDGNGGATTDIRAPSLAPFLSCL